MSGFFSKRHKPMLLIAGLLSCLAVAAASTRSCTETKYRKELRQSYSTIKLRTCRGMVNLSVLKNRYEEVAYTEDVCCDKRKTYPYCDVYICQPECEVGNICVADDRCECHPGSSATCNIEPCNTSHDCYPGSCQSDGTTCQCAAAFKGTNCDTMKEGPVFDKCEVSLLDSNNSTLDTASCSTTDKNKVVYTNKKDFSYIRIHHEQTYRKLVDVPTYPNKDYLRNFEVGLVESNYEINVIGDTLYIKDCSKSANYTNPYERIICKEYYENKYDVVDKKIISIKAGGQTGGYKEICPYDTDKTQCVKKIIKGQSDERIVQFKFDLALPYHCSDDRSCCTNTLPCPNSVNVYDPISTLDDITTAPEVTLLFLGWYDKDSLLDKYSYDVYRMSWNGTQVVEQDYPIRTGQLNLVDEENDVRFTLPASGMYSIMGHVSDFAGNIRHCRALVFYLEKTKGVIKTDKTMSVRDSVNIINNSYWLNRTDQIVISWEDLFTNTYIENWLGPIKKIEDGLDYTHGNISLDGTANIKGITKFLYSFAEDIVTIPPTEWHDVPGGIQTTFSVPSQHSFKVITFWIKAEDLFGNAQVAYIHVGCDSTAPRVGAPTFTKNVDQPQQGFFSRVDLLVADLESGIDHMDYVIYSANSIEIRRDSQQGEVLSNLDENTCSTRGYWTKFECFPRIQSIYINNCLFVNHPNSTARIEINIYNRALLHQTVKLEINTAGIRGINEYPPPYGFRVKKSWGLGATLTWYWPEACYPIKYIMIHLKEDSSIFVKLSEKEKIETDIYDLTPYTNYTATIYAVYETGNRSSITEMKFNTGEKDKSPILTVGGYVGIALAVLLFICILIIIIMIIIRVKVRNEPAMPRRVAEFGTNIRHRFSKLYGSRDDYIDPEGKDTLNMTKNVVYKSVPKLKDFEKDISIYGEMKTDSNATWKYSSDHVVVGNPLYSGRFAQIRKGSLSSKEGTKPVAIKMLKERTADNIRLMKAKMNFLATAVPHHNNIVNFIGAVPDDLIIILEFCELNLREWLKKITKVDEDVEDNMINFCTDIARGMQHLHQNQIIHRRLGARNVLLKHVPMMGRMVAKITGFGPMRGETLNDSGQERIPLKWMAPEQLGLGNTSKRPYNNETDIWMYGITIWEIYSKGEQPFANNKISEIKTLLDSGVRPDRPNICPEELYERVMLKCWQQSPSNRPTFAEICSNLEKLFSGAPDGDEYYEDQYGSSHVPEYA